LGAGPIAGSKADFEMEYAELTADDQLRQTMFLGWRDDKKAKEVVLELTETA